MRLATDVRAIARTMDGVMEAIEMNEHPEVLAVQWHPEETAERDAKQQALFDWLVDQARTKR